MYTGPMEENPYLVVQAGFVQAGRDASTMVYKPLKKRLDAVMARKREIMDGFLYASAAGSNELSKLHGEEAVLTGILNAIVEANKGGDK